MIVERRPPSAAGFRFGGRGGRRSTVLVAIVLVAIVAIHDFAMPRGHGFAARGAIFAIDEYRAHVSPHLRGVVRCRFTPTCSFYGRESIRKYGFLRGSLRTAYRLGRCGPWTKQGTVDPP